MTAARFRAIESALRELERLKPGARVRHLYEWAAARAEVERVREIRAGAAREFHTRTSEGA